MPKHELPPEVEPVDPAMEVASLKHVVKELSDKIQLLVDHLDLNDMLEDHCFTFPDGDIWKAQDVNPVEGERSELRGKTI